MLIGCLAHLIPQPRPHPRTLARPTAAPCRTRSSNLTVVEAAEVEAAEVAVAVVAMVAVVREVGASFVFSAPPFAPFVSIVPIFVLDGRRIPINRSITSWRNVEGRSIPSPCRA